MTLQLHRDQNISVSDEEELKKDLLQVSDLTDVEKNYSLSALRIFKERYLLKDNEGKTVERLDELFKRVAVGVGLMEILYDSNFFDFQGTQKINPQEIIQYNIALATMRELNKSRDYKDINVNPDIWEEFHINHYHMETLTAKYVDLFAKGHMRISGHDLVGMTQSESIKQKYLPLVRKYYNLMINKVFLPNTPALMNVGTKLGMNAACFTLDIQDDLHDIFQTYMNVADIFKSGGGIGVNYSKLRPEGSLVKGTGGTSSGMVSFLKLMDGVVDIVKQGGKRRGAAMAILDLEHKEIERFITLKDNKTLENHNISINTPDHFFKNLHSNPTYRKIMDMVATNAWKTGDPGMVFTDNMNSNNLLREVMDGKPIDVTNPCSEISMYPYESCILASINLGAFVNNKDKKFNFEEFGDVVQTVTQFLDSLIDATRYPIEKIHYMTNICRRIGVGFMGLADALVRLGIPYNSEKGFKFTETVSREMTMNALKKSGDLAQLKGAFSLWYNGKYPKHKLPVNELMATDLDKEHPFRERGLRNCSVTTVAPTGTLSMMCDCSSGIEPHFSLSFVKKVTIGDFVYINKDLEAELEKHHRKGMLTTTPVGSIKNIKSIPSSIRKVFVTAMDIHPFDHLMMQASAQKWITNGISKTINLPFDSMPSIIEQCYTLSWALGNKGIAVYRDGCKEEQVLNAEKVSIKDVYKPCKYTVDTLKVLKLPEPNLELDKGLIIGSKDKKKDKVEIKCPSCGSKKLIKSGRGDTCFLCPKCLSSMGSCD